MNEIRQGIASGTYRVDSSKVAGEMLERALLIRWARQALVGDKSGRASVKQPTRRSSEVSPAGRVPLSGVGAR